jgi:hypothetical protein
MSYTVADVITYARTLAQTDSNGISDASGILFASDAKQNIARALLERNVDAMGTAESYATLSPSDNPAGKFAWPSDMYAVKTIEVDYTGSGGQNFLQTQPVEVANLQNISFDYLRANQPITMPLIDNSGDVGELFPTPKVATTIRIIYYVTPADYTSTSDTIVYPYTLDYKCLSARIAELYALSLGEGAARSRYAVSLVSAMGQEYEKRLKDIINILAPSSQQPVQATPIQVTGWQF